MKIPPRFYDTFETGCLSHLFCVTVYRWRLSSEFKGRLSMAKTILSVDDSGSIRQMVSFTLKSAGYTVIEAVDGQDGMDKARQKTVDLVLTDQNMPRMDGLSLIKALRTLPEYRKVPIMMLTTESSDEIKARGRAAGATGWIVKPFDPQKLLEVVKKILG